MGDSTSRALTSQRVTSAPVCQQFLIGVRMTIAFFPYGTIYAPISVSPGAAHGPTAAVSSPRFPGLRPIASFQAFHPDFAASQHLSWAILPCIGTLALLPSDPGAWITPEARPAFTLEPLVRAVSPRAPPA